RAGRTPRSRRATARGAQRAGGRSSRGPWSISLAALGRRNVSERAHAGPRHQLAAALGLRGRVAGRRLGAADLGGLRAERVDARVLAVLALAPRSLALDHRGDRGAERSGRFLDLARGLLRAPCCIVEALAFAVGRGLAQRLLALVLFGPELLDLVNQSRRRFELRDLEIGAGLCLGGTCL